MSTRATAEISAPRLGLAGSVALHAGIVAATLFTWTHRLDIVEQSSHIVPIDLVTVADQTNVAPMVKADVPPAPVPPVPDMIQPQAQPVPEEPKFEIAPAAVPKPAPVQKPQTKKDQFDNILNTLLDKRQTTVATAKNAKPGPQTVTGIGSQNAMTADLRDALTSQIKPCWSPPVGAPKGADLVVDFDLFLNPDGSVAQPPQLTADSRAAVASNPYTRAAAEAARRAIYTCAPYKLPANRYAQWREINPFHFDPSVMMGL